MYINIIIISIRLFLQIEGTKFALLLLSIFIDGWYCIQMLYGLNKKKPERKI